MGNNVIKDIIRSCEEHGIFGYTICKDALGFYLDVDSSVFLSFHKIDAIPLRFGYVTGNFHCNSNSLTSLEYCPNEVGGDFYCGYNQLTSLDGCPVSVGGSFICGGNYLTSLEGCPKIVGGDFEVGGNYLTSLEFCPVSVGGSFICGGNQLTSLMHCPVSVGNTIICYDNTSLPTECYHHLFELGYDIGSIGCSVDLVGLYRQWVIKGIINE